MINMENLKRQHKEVRNLVEDIEGKITKGHIEENAMELAKNNSLLAGKLRIHLNTEDRYLYPTLSKSNDGQLRKFSSEYSKEMDTILDKFMNYKDKYNTKSKILNDKDGYIKETKSVINTLKNRIDKEDVHLYPLLDKH